MSEREDDLRSLIATIRKALDEGAAFRDLVKLGNRASTTLEFRFSDATAGLPPVPTALLEELMNLRSAIWDRMGINKPAAPKPPVDVTPAMEKVVSRLERALKTKKKETLDLAVDRGSDLLDELIDHRDELTEAAVALREQLRQLVIAGFKRQREWEYDPVPIALPPVVDTITVRRRGTQKSVDLGPSTDFDEFVFGQLKDARYLEWHYDYWGDSVGPADALADVSGDIANTPQSLHICRSIGKLITHNDEEIRGQALDLLTSWPNASRVCVDLLFAAIESADRRRLGDARTRAGTTHDSMLMYCLARLVDAQYRGAPDLAMREVLRPDIEASPLGDLIGALIRRDRKWVEEHRDAIAQKVPEHGKIVDDRLSAKS